MKGRRLPDDSEACSLGLGDYVKITEPEPFFYCCSPNGLFGNLSKHKVIEHEDGTITVSPSILIQMASFEYHGYLERGIWKQA